MKIAILLFLICAPVLVIAHIEKSQIVAQKSFGERQRIRALKIMLDEIDALKARIAVLEK